MLSTWLRNRRRRQIISRPLGVEAEQTFRRYVRHFSKLPPAQHDRAIKIVQVLLAEKDWSAAGRFQLTEQMRVAIAGNAAVLASGFPKPYYFDRLRAIVVHRRTIHFTAAQTARNPLLPDGQLAGIAWHRGPIVLSWAEMERERRNRRPGRNVVMHEFAHYFDGLHGEMDGTPPLNRSALRRWEKVAESEFLRLVGNNQRRESSLLDKYGATSRAEFFAVATECFFEQPHSMRRRHAELYDVLADFYQQTPADWLPQREIDLIEPRKARSSRLRRGAVPDAAENLGGENERRRLRRDDLARLQALESMSAGDALFTLGLGHLQDGRNEDADRALTELIDADPTDEEALAHRAIARLRCGNLNAARADCEAALTIDPEDVDALWVRGEIAMHNENLKAALEDLNVAAALAENDADVRLVRGRVLLRMGQASRAVNEFSRAITIDPYLAPAYHFRGRAYETMGKRTAAERDLNKAALLDPDMHNLYG